MKSSVGMEAKRSNQAATDKQHPSLPKYSSADREAVKLSIFAFGVDSGRRYHLGMAMTKHCWKCGTEWTFARSPGRSETCVKCQADLKVCLNCTSYDKTVAYQCRDRRADEVADKATANYCEYFEIAKREFVPVTEGLAREAKAKDALKRLLG